MFAVIFEVQPRAERVEDYLGLAQMLRPELLQIDGFVDVERFRSQRTEGRMLSLSIWRDEKALIRWRTHARHHDAQTQGRFEIFADYRLRVGEITADTGMANGQALPQQRFDPTETGPAKLATVVEPRDGSAETLREFVDGLAGPVGSSRADGLVDAELYASITTPGKLLAIVSWRDEAALAAWERRRTAESNGQGSGSLRHRTVRIIRDYGLLDRGEAPQYYPPVDQADREARVTERPSATEAPEH